MADRGVRHPPMAVGEMQVWTAAYAQSFVAEWEVRRAHPGQHSGSGEALYAAELASQAVEQLRAVLPELAEVHGGDSELVAQAMLVLGQWHPGRKVGTGG